MKVFIDCDCILTQKTLELFLKDSLSAYESADFIISDKDENIYTKPLFYVSNLEFPFKEKELYEKVNAFYSNIKNNSREVFLNIDNEISLNKNENFETKLDRLLNNFKNDLIKLIREENAK